MLWGGCYEEEGAPPYWPWVQPIRFLLREVIQVLLEYPGKDRINLQIHTGGRRILMELPVLTTGYSEALRGRLEELLGLDTVAFQPVVTTTSNGEAPF